MKLIRPFNPILGLLSMQYCSAVPREAVEKYGKEFRGHPVGTGPFQIKSWEENQTLILLKNPHYYEYDSAGRQLPYLDAVKIAFNDEAATEFLQFVQGQLDFVNKKAESETGEDSGTDELPKPETADEQAGDSEADKGKGKSVSVAAAISVNYQRATSEANIAIARCCGLPGPPEP